MDSVGWGMLLRPLIGLAILIAVFGVPILLARLLRPYFPEGRLKNVLFRERGGQSASPARDPTDRVIDLHPLPGRHSRDE